MPLISHEIPKALFDRHDEVSDYPYVLGHLLSLDTEYADFYKKILDKSVYDDISKKEEENTLKKGNIFPTKEGTIITFINNNHVWFHCPKKLYELLKELKGKEVTIVGGADSECLEDVVITAESLGVKIKRDYKYIYTATSCPIK